MASSVELYTSGHVNEIVELISVSTEAAGFNVENVFDQNRDTYYKGTAGTSWQIKFQLSTYTSIDSVFFNLQNYTTVNASETFTVESSPDNITWTTRASSQDLSDTSSPIRYANWTTVSNARWWRITFTTAGTIPNISMLHFGKKNTIAYGNQYPENDLLIYKNNNIKSNSGRQLVRGLNKTAINEFSRTYLINGTTYYEALISVHDNSMGSKHPILVQEGSANSDAFICRLGQDAFNKNEIEYQIYNPTIKFIEIPYIKPGNTY